MFCRPRIFHLLNGITETTQVIKSRKDISRGPHGTLILQLLHWRLNSFIFLSNLSNINFTLHSSHHKRFHSTIIKITTKHVGLYRITQMLKRYL